MREHIAKLNRDLPSSQYEQPMDVKQIDDMDL